MEKIANNITELVGNTPLVKLKNFSKETNSEIIAKIESFNPCGSVKDRIGMSMIEAAEKEGKIVKNTVLIEPTSGNTGIALAFVCAAKKYDLILTMPDTMSIERRNLLKAFGATPILTPGENGMKGAVEKANELAEKNKNYLLLQQFKNSANPQVHRENTAEEIWKDTEGNIDILVAGVGTGGTITGISEILKEKNPALKTVAVEPENSPVLSEGKSGPHGIQGIGAGFIPDVLNTEIIDEVITVKDKQAKHFTQELVQKEGILAGISSGAALYAALQISKREWAKSKTMVIIFPDTGERYLSTDLFC